ncbi:hypothetical protein C1637_00855 [Chryseobacterium lactis]|uniref:ABC transporter permease n=1 Tax=Chryseobacterium lactis TaxID=1241981 RepID=A0A3G6RMH2_CHRLC|nr:DUF5687 family protein [Chryseobacterium lactis]AZA81161.1 hypothetical protein EG342_04240 [Chryseobacterium lactis]AZB06162.1 hypothetical protein EG341_20365 [Chryseobacterium lactis]PNW15012.1 hypothetical protein C1637_00855 [Chryseobacterium lactis]
MFLKFLRLEIKSFFRGTSLGINLTMKILRFIGILYFMGCLAGGAFLVFFLVQEEMHQDPIKVVSKFLIAAWIVDLALKYLWQEIPTQNIKPFLTLNIRKNTLVNYMLTKSFLSAFSWLNSLFFITFAAIALFKGYSFPGMLVWFIGVSAIFYLNNFLNIFFNDKETVAIIAGIICVVLGVLGYYNIIPILSYSEKIFYSFYEMNYAAVVPVILFVVLWLLCFRYVRKEFYLDQGLEAKKTIGKTENIAFLNKYGAIGTFINNDIKMLRRNKVTKGILLGSFMFLFYGLLMFTSSMYKTPAMMMFMGLFVTGGFQFLFGQRVPAFDSSYYPLMMTLNVPYKEYLKAKWWLMNIVTAVSIVIALCYAYFGWEVYITFFAAGLYNIGVNSQFTLWSGAFNKTQIDLNSKEKRLGQKNSFNMVSMFLLIPKMLLPMAVFALTKYFFGITAGVVSIAFLGFIGFLLRERIFDIIVKLYKKEKYNALDAFKNKG